MISLRTLVAACVVWCLSASALADDRAVWEALRLQVAAWSDLGRHAQALDLSMRGVAANPADPRWHAARLHALDAAGLTPWIEAEYPERAGGAWAAGRQLWELQTARLLGLPRGADDAIVVREAAFSAWRAGDDAPLESLAPTLGDGEASRDAWLRLWAGKGAWELAEASVRAFPEGSWVSLDGLADVARRAQGQREAKRLLRAIEGVVGGRLGRTTEPLALHHAAAWALAVGDDARLEAAATALDRLRIADDTPARLRALDSVPRGFTSWEAPRAARRSPEALAALGVLLGRKGDKARLPWLRADEARAVASAAVVWLEARGRDDLPAAWRDQLLGRCAPAAGAERAVARGAATQGRAVAEAALLRCVGTFDVIPDDDPVGLDVGGRVETVAAAWWAFGRVLVRGDWPDDAAVALTIATRLSPDAARFALARRAASSASLARSPDGLVAPEAVDVYLDKAVWLRPPDQLRAARSGRTVARTRAWLAPSIESFAAQALPADGCVSTLILQCRLHVAVGEALAAREGVRVPEALAGRPTDAGARRAAETWIAALFERRFVQQAALSRLVREAAGDTRDLADLLAAGTGRRVGRQAPTWSAGGLRGEDLRGATVVLWFWASWHRPSVAAIPLLDDQARRWDRDGLDVRVIAVGVDGAEDPWRRAIAPLEWQTMQVVRDPATRATFRATELPTLAVIDARGVLVTWDVGYGAIDGARLDAIVRSWARPHGG